jgi:hypothetical protein
MIWSGRVPTFKHFMAELWVTGKGKLNKSKLGAQITP